MLSSSSVLRLGRVSLLRAQVAEPVQGPRGPQRVARLAREVEPGPQPRLRLPRIAGLDRRAARQRQRAGAHGGIDVTVERAGAAPASGPPRAGACRGSRTAQAPRPASRRARRPPPRSRSRAPRGGCRRRSPAGRATRAPAGRARTSARATRASSMCSAWRRRTAASGTVLGQPVVRELADRLEHREAVAPAADEARLDERRHVAGGQRVAHALGRLHHPAAREHGEAGEQVALRLVQQVVAPRVAAVSVRCRAGASRLPVRAGSRSSSGSASRAAVVPRARAAASSSASGAGRAARRSPAPRAAAETRVRLPGALDEERDRIVERERLHTMAAFPRTPSGTRLVATIASSGIAEPRRPRLRGLERCSKLSSKRSTRRPCSRCSSSRRRRARAPPRSSPHERRIAQRGEVDEVDAVGEVVDEPRRRPRSRAASCRCRPRPSASAARSPARTSSSELLEIAVAADQRRPDAGRFEFGGGSAAADESRRSRGTAGREASAGHRGHARPRWCARAASGAHRGSRVGRTRARGRSRAG